VTAYITIHVGSGDGTLGSLRACRRSLGADRAGHTRCRFPHPSHNSPRIFHTIAKVRHVPRACRSLRVNRSIGSFGCTFSVTVISKMCVHSASQRWHRLAVTQHRRKQDASPTTRNRPRQAWPPGAHRHGATTSPTSGRSRMTGSHSWAGMSTARDRQMLGTCPRRVAPFSTTTWPRK